MIRWLKNQAETADFFQNVSQFLLIIPLKQYEEEEEEEKEENPTKLEHIEEYPFFYFVQNLMETVWQRRIFMRERERESERYEKGFRRVVFLMSARRVFDLVI